MPGAGGRPTQRSPQSNGSCATLRLQPRAGAEHFGALQARAEARDADRARAPHRANQVLRSQRIAALRRGARGQRARELGRARRVEREPRQRRRTAAPNTARIRVDELLAPASRSAAAGCGAQGRALIERAAPLSFSSA